MTDTVFKIKHRRTDEWAWWVDDALDAVWRNEDTGSVTHSREIAENTARALGGDAQILEFSLVPFPEGE